MTKTLIALTCLLLAVPMAGAHNTVQTDDGAYFLTVGHRSEPTATYLRSGLDLIIRENNNGERGDEVPDLADQLQATVISPSGEELSQPLVKQYGAVGRYSFGDPYILTEPGQYQLRLVGTIGDTAVDGLYDISGPLDDFRDLTFPRTDVPTLLELQDRIAALEAEHAHHAMEEAAEEGEDSPGVGMLALLVGLVGLAAWRRR
ncbi:MAG: hypothetical protein ACPHID_01190 [Thermoplasmatota archaeon]